MTAATCPVCHARPADVVLIDPTDASGPVGMVSCTPCTSDTAAGFASIAPSPDDPADTGMWSYGRRLRDARAIAADPAYGPDGYHATDAPDADRDGYIAAVARVARAVARDGGPGARMAVSTAFGIVDPDPYGVAPSGGPTTAEYAAVAAVNADYRDARRGRPAGRR